MTIEKMGLAYVLHYCYGTSWEMVAAALGVDFEYFNAIRLKAELLGFAAFRVIDEINN